MTLIKSSARSLTNLKRFLSSSLNNTNQGSQLKSWKEIPGPSSLPFFGPLHHFLPGGSLRILKNMEDILYKTYGPIVRLDKLLGKPASICLFDPESSAMILRSENWAPVRPGFRSLKYYRDNRNKMKGKPNASTGLITDQGEDWRNIRMAVNPVLMHTKTIRLYSEVLEEVAEDMIERIRSKRDKNGMIQKDFYTDVSLWALESIGVVALARRLNCLDPNLPEDSQERKLINCIHEVFQIIFDLDFLPSMSRIYATRKFKRAMKLYEEQEKLIKYFFDMTKEDTKLKREVPDEEKGILEKLLAIDQDIALAVASDMFLTGVDTTTNAVLSLLYLLAKNPEKQNKLRSELAKNEKAYLKACFKESLRMMPQTPGNMRQTTKEYDMLGYRIPKDMFISIFHKYMSSMECHYPRPQEYIPERWLEEDSPLHHGNAHPFAYSPFGFGVRSCVGRRIAGLEIETLVSKIIMNFKLDWTGPPPDMIQRTVNVVLGPYNYIFKDI